MDRCELTRQEAHCGARENDDDECGQHPVCRENRSLAVRPAQTLHQDERPGELAEILDRNPEYHGCRDTGRLGSQDERPAYLRTDRGCDGGTHQPLTPQRQADNEEQGIYCGG